MKSVNLELTEDMVKESFRNGKRPDGRAMDEYRKIDISYDVSKNADGSARVKIGNTDVICGVKLEIGQPFPDSPGEGAIITGVELSALASPDFESGPPRVDSIELARVVDRCVRESKTIDLKKLCVVEGEHVFIMFIDLYVLNAAGNLFDAFGLAALAALNKTRIPKLDKEHKIIRKEYEGSLKLNRLPVLSTFAKVGNTVLLDPSLEEEKTAIAKFSVATTEDGNISAFQKSGMGSFTADEISSTIDIAIKQSKAIRKLLK